MSGPPAQPRRGWERLRHLLDRRDGRELEMAFNRIGFAVAIAYTISVFELPPDAQSPNVVLAYLAISLLMLLHVLRRPAPSTPRRAFALITDVTVLSIGLHDGGEPLSMLFPIYLWITLGNGFRFGRRWLYSAMALSAVSFAAVIVTTPFWHDKDHLAFGLLLGLVVVPVYAGALIGKLSAAQRVAEAANEAKSLFLAGVSHELRTPLSAILGMGTVLRTTVLDAAQRDMLRTVDSAARSLLTLIEGVLDYSRIESGETPTRLEEVDLLRLTDEVRRLLAGQAMEKGVQFDFHITARVPGALLLDPRHVTTVLLNLAGNSLKFTDAGAVVIAFDAEPLGQGRLRLRCEVSDTGIGVAAEAQSRIFESFTQADPAIRYRYGGTGLGLSICRRLVEAMGGEIGVRSEAGQGASFWFTIEVLASAPPADVALQGEVLLLGAEAMAAAGALAAHPGLTPRPIADTAALAAALRGAPAEGLPRVAVAGTESLGWLDAMDDPPPAILLLPGSAGALPGFAWRQRCRVALPPLASPAAWRRGLRLALGPSAPSDAAEALRRSAAPRSVLVADDNRVNRRVVGAVLERAGHRVLMAANGEEALDILESGAVDCVLMDLNMPGMDGVETLKLHRFAVLGEGARAVPMIALTADATPEAEARCREAGFDLFLLKPVAPRRLLEALEQVTRRVEEDQAAASPLPVPVEAARPAAVATAALDPAVIESLIALGGAAFVEELARDFIEDAAGHLASMAVAVEAGDVLGFRAAAHGMRSIAANLGARAVEEGCQQAERLPPGEFVHKGPAILVTVEREIERVAGALGRPLAGPAGGGPPHASTSTMLPRG